MKKFFTSFLSAVPALILMWSCGSPNENKEEELKFATFSYDLIGELNDSLNFDTEGSNYCRVTGGGVLPVAIAGFDITELRDSLMKLAEITMIGANDAEPLVTDMTLTNLNADSVNACGINVNQLSIDLITDRLIVWKDYSYTYLCGAAHGMGMNVYVNYSLAEGKILQLQDIFRDEYDTELLELIRKKLVSDKVQLLVSPEEVEMPSDYRLLNNSIEFVYPPYEIAPYSSGEIRVEFYIDEIEDLFRPGVAKMLYGN